jgi:hypothetical protein
MLVHGREPFYELYSSLELPDILVVKTDNIEFLLVGCAYLEYFIVFFMTLIEDSMGTGEIRIESRRGTGERLVSAE